MTSDSPSRLKVLWILPPIIIGIVILLMMKNARQLPQPADNAEPVRTVRTQLIQKSDFIPIAKGFGVVQPAQVWKAIAQVSGRITELHPRLKNGEIITQGEILFQIDPVDYELNLARAETRLAELDVQQKNAQASLKIEQRNLDLSEKENLRLQNLVKKGSVSRSDADAAERIMLNSRTQVQNLKNTLALLPSQKKLQQAEVIQARRDLENTHIQAPFNLRVSALDIETDQYVSKGQHLFSGDSVDRIEIIAQVPISSLKNLFINHPDLPETLVDLSNNLAQFTGFRPGISLDIGNQEKARWEASFVRFTDSVDAHTRTMGVVVAVDNPLQQVIPGVRPPLSKGMFVEVDIAGHTQPGQLLIPQIALHSGHVYIMNEQNRLEIRTVKERYHQQDISVIDSGIVEGEQLVLTDLVPAIEGMLLKSVSLSSGE